MEYTYQYPRPAVTTDNILIHKQAGTYSILLIKRLNHPFKDAWALPGGFVDENESLLKGALRELKEETNIDNINLIQFKAYGEPGRDPRGHTISVIFYVFIEGELPHAIAGDDAKQLQWYPLYNLPPLAFDHNEIIQDFIREKMNPASF